jgi:hypothetical protein
MATLQQVQDVLERVLGTRPMPFHYAFWRGKTRDEMVATRLFGRPLIVPGRPEESPLIWALRRASAGERGGPRAGSKLIRAYFGQARAGDGDVAVLEEWIRDGCPEAATAPTPRRASVRGLEAAPATDARHVEYWRAIDAFFLPSLASPETVPHVLRMHGDALEAWVPSMVSATDPARWPGYLASPEVAGSFAFVRHHQRRLIREFYGESPPDLIDSLWKFGGNLLPTDPLSLARPEHTMNGVLDWFFWAPYLDATLRAPDAEPIDHDLARGWQIGIVADGLLRTDADRPEGQRMPISDFSATDPDLRSNVLAKYVGADPSMLIAEMVRRAKESGFFV